MPVLPLGVSLRAAGVLRRVVGGRGNGRDKLLKVHHVGQEGVLRSGAFWVDRPGAVRSQLYTEREIEGERREKTEREKRKKEELVKHKRVCVYFKINACSCGRSPGVAGPGRRCEYCR